MKRITISVKQYSLHYCLWIEPAALQNPRAYQGLLTSRDVVVITHTALAKRYLPYMQAAWQKLPRTQQPRRVIVLTVPPGERSKSLVVMERLINQLVQQHIRRDALLIALGGGVIGDLVGFVAATYQRGIDYLQIPTTLLAQVDSSFGGKTAVNGKAVKNMIGAFHHPKAVIIDPQTLLSLTARDFSAGLAEVIKHALLAGVGEWRWLNTHYAQINARHMKVLTEMVARSCQIKAQIIASDPKESKNGLRYALNLGHTCGHALEVVAGLGKMRHGEAIAIGLMLELRLAEQMLLLSSKVRRDLQQLLQRFSLPIDLPKGLSKVRLLLAMQKDKKNDVQGITFSLLSALGEPKLLANVPVLKVKELLKNS